MALAFIMILYPGGNIFFHTGHFHGREILTIGQLRKSVSIAADTGKSLDIIIPGRYVLIAHRPVDRNALFGIGGKVKITQPVTLPSPHERTAAYMISPEPIQTLY